MSRHIKYVCDYLEQELSSLRGADFDEAVRIIEQATRNAERKRKSQEAYDKIFLKLDKCRDEYAKIDMYHNQKFERSMGLLWKPEAPARRLLDLLHMGCLMFVCSNMVANELESFAAFKPVQVTADLLNARYAHLHIPEVVWKKAKNRLELPQLLMLDSRAKKEELMNCRRKRPHSPGPERDQSPGGSRPPTTSKRSKMSPSSSLGNDEGMYHPPQDDYAHYTPLSKVTVVEFMLTYRKWPDLVYLISPKNYGILPSLEMDPDMYATLIERAKAIARRDEGNDAAVQSLEGQTYVIT